MEAWEAWEVLYKVNSTGIRRRRSGLPRGTKMAPQGRPAKVMDKMNAIPIRHKAKSKRSHKFPLAEQLTHSLLS